MKRTSLLLIGIIFSSLSIHSQEVEVDSIKTEGWKRSGITSFLVNQTAFSNWISGGENSIAATLTVDYNINYYKNGWSWDTKMIGCEFGSCPEWL